MVDADLARALQTPLYLPTDSARLGQSTHSHHQRNHHHRATLAGIPSASFPLPSHAAKPSAPSSPEVLRQALASALCLSPRLSRADRVTRRNTVPYMTSLQRARLEEQRQGLLIEESSEDEAANHLFYLSPSSSNSSTGSADVQSRDVELRSTAPRTDFSKDEQSVSSTRGKNERSVQDRFQNWTNSSADREPNNNHKLSTTLNETRRASEGDAVSSHAACAPSSGDPDWRRSSADSAHAQFDANRWSERSGTFPSFLWPPSLGEDLGSLPDFFRGDLYQNLPYGATFPPAYPASFPSTALFSHWGSPRNNVSGGSFDSLYSMGSFPSTNSSIQSVGDFSVSVQSAKDPSVATSQWRGENASFRGSVDSSSSTSASSGCQAGKEGEERQRQGRHRHARDKKRVTFIELVDDSQTPALVDTTGKVVEKLTDKCMAREVAAPPPVYFAPIGRVLFDMLTKKQPPSTPPKSPKGEMMEMTADFLLFCLAIKAAFNPQPPP
nr:hypothetical protein BaRGS_029758 [Batillaria attramentaria]